MQRMDALFSAKEDVDGAVVTEGLAGVAGASDDGELCP